MNIKEAKKQITDTLRAYLCRDELGNYRIPPIRQRPVLLMGPPGIGKTQIMEQIAAEQGVGLVAYTITHHTRQSAMGLPFIEKRTYDGTEYSVTGYTMSEIIGSVHELMEKTGIREGILFLDEINCVSETLAPMMLQFLQCKTFGNQRLPEGWLIVAAGNPPEYNRSVRDFDVVTLDRIKRMDVREDYGVWKEYALRKGLHPAVLSYLELQKDHFYCMENTADGLQFVTARGWEDLSELLYVYEDLGITADASVTVQYLQLPRIARGFANYLSLYYKYRQSYRIDDILAGKWTALTESEFKSAPFDEKYAVMSLMLAKLSRSARECRLQDALTDRLYRDLVSLRQGPDGADPAGLLQELSAQRSGQLSLAAAAGQEDKEQKLLTQTEIARLEAFRDDLTRSGLHGEAAMDRLKALLKEEIDKRASLADTAGGSFDAAFRFLEGTVGPGQELVLFVTEITAGYDTAWYVGQFGCEAYYRNNHDLLFQETRRHILSELADLDKI